MKRIFFLSCSMVLAMLLFSKPATAQSLHTWPTSLSGLALKSDTIYICADIDTIHPIELGYDIPGLRLHPSYGDWSLYAISDKASPNDYAVSNAKNEGAGNAFKVVGSGIGGYVFQYIAKSTQCGLAVGESYFVYVFIIPSLNIPLSKDTLLCKQPAGSSLPTNIISYFPHAELYQKANLTLTWNPAAFPVMPTDSVDMKVYTSTFTVSGAARALGCGTTGIFNYTVDVSSEGFTLDPISVNVCVADTVGSLANRNPNVYFGRSAGTYSPATIGNNWGGTSQSYVFTYVDCLGNAKTVTDVLQITSSPADQNWGRDTLFICRTQVANVVDLYNLSQGITPISLLPTNSTWADRGVTGTLPLVFGSSGASVFSLPSSVNIADAGANIGYNFLYRMDPSLCFGGDTGLFILMVHDPFKAVDFRTQLCTDYLPSNSFDLGAFTGIENGSWRYVGALATAIDPISNNQLTSAQLVRMGIGTHKLSYTVPAGCGGGGVGVMYIKIGGKASIPANVSERYCKRTLPSSINVNEVLGFSGLPAGANNAWTLESVSNAGSSVSGGALAAARLHFTPATGVFNMSALTDPATDMDLSAATSARPLELTFRLTGATCNAGGGTSELKIIIIDDIIIP